jgi:hypothetical protein
MNTFEAAVIARLKTAGLLEIAERAAARAQLRLADCIAPGEVTGGHRVLWRELARHAGPDRISEIVGVPLRDLRREIGSLPPAVEALKARSPEARAKAVAGRLRRLRTSQSNSRSDMQKLRREVASLRRRVENLAAAQKPPSDAAWRIVAEVAAACRVSVGSILAKLRGEQIDAARAEVIARLSRDLKWTPPKIAEFLGRDPTTIIHHLARRRPGPGKAAA